MKRNSRIATVASFSIGALWVLFTSQACSSDPADGQTGSTGTTASGTGGATAVGAGGATAAAVGAGGADAAAVGAGGAATSAAVGAGGAVTAGGASTAGGATSAGGTGGATGSGAGGALSMCTGIGSDETCPMAGSCENLLCGIADTGTRTCVCDPNHMECDPGNSPPCWECSSCAWGTDAPAWVQSPPAEIVMCEATAVDDAPCPTESAVCLSVNNPEEFCACWLRDTADMLIWDCDDAPSHWEL